MRRHLDGPILYRGLDLISERSLMTKMKRYSLLLSSFLWCCACQNEPGTESLPQAILNPITLTLTPPLSVGEPVRGSISVEHLGGADLIISEVKLIEYDEVSELAIIDQADWRNRRLGGEATERIEVEWTPRDAQPDQADLIFSTNIGSLIAKIETSDLDASLEVSISGEWLSISGEGSAQRITFDGVSPGQRGDALITLQSVGLEPLEITGMCLSAMGGGCINQDQDGESIRFQLCESALNNGCIPVTPPPPLNLGESYTISLRYLAPEREIDSESIQLLVNSNAVNAPRFLVDVIGRPCLVDVNAEVCNLEFCGDGVIQEGEACDDGDEDEENGCNTVCELNRCGDGVLHQGVEECDDGNENNNDDCLATCQLASCGDGYLWEEMEECDDGDEDDQDRCLVGCVLASCGDGVLWAGVEGCDDGNNIDDDGCSNACTSPSCGDGVIQAPQETCDEADDNGSECDYGEMSCLVCTEACQSMMALGEYCGDGIINGPESCDRGEGEIEQCPYGQAACEVCDDQCQLRDIAGGFCGDNIINGQEECDGQEGCEETCVLSADAPTCVPYCPVLDWRLIDSGSFEMGFVDGTEQERPVHQVTVATFEMTRSEVTLAQYTSCVNAGVCSEPRDRNDNQRCNWGTVGREQHPVNCLTWSQARTFAQWVGGDLPSEVQWERAARGAGGAGLYPWSTAETSPEPSCEYAVMEDEGTGCGLMSTWPVCQKPQGESAEGVCDLLGNVWEWTLDAYQPYVSIPRDDAPRCLNIDCTGAPNTRTLRGGGWTGYTPGLRATVREGYSPRSALNFFGLRVVRPMSQ